MLAPEDKEKFGTLSGLIGLLGSHVSEEKGDRCTHFTRVGLARYMA